MNTLPIDPKHYDAIRKLANDALAVQDACNLTGVVHAFSRAMTALREAIPNQGTEFYNRHPISVMYSSKIQSLTHSNNCGEFSFAYDELCKVVGK